MQPTRWVPILPADAGDEADKDVDGKDNDSIFVAEKLRRLYVNSFAVRAAAQVHLDLSDPVASGMRNMMFRTRLKNLNKAYVEVARALRESLGSDAA